MFFVSSQKPKGNSIKTHRTIAGWLILLPLISVLAVKADQYGDFTYSTDGTNATITGYTGAGGTIIIPDMINSLPVTSIGYGAFWGCTSLTNVMIPDSVTSIVNMAFAYCSSLTSVTIGTNVTSIGYGAFRDCTSITSVTIPNSVTSIVDFAFLNCYSLTSVTIGTNVTSIGMCAFEDCSALTSVAIPNSVTSIGHYAFFYCTSLTNVTIPNSITNIGDRVFSSCTSLISVTIPNSVTQILYAAFRDCTSITSITIPNRVTYIADSAFNGCINLTGVFFKSNAPGLGPYVFDGDNKATVYHLPGTKGWGPTFGGRPTAFWDPPTQFGYTTNGNIITIKAYFGSGGAVTVPDTLNGMPVNSIGTNAFESCNSITAVTIPDSVTNIGNSAFSACTNLAAVYFRGNCPTVGSSVFYQDNNTTAYYLPRKAGWDSPTFGGCPTALWLPQVQTSDGSFGVWTNQFGFNINWASGQTVVVEACTNLTNPVWSPVGTNILTGGPSYFSDPQWTNYPGRFYRLRSP